MQRKFLTMDGNEAAAHVSYAFTELAAIYPITPSSPMADFIDRWSAEGRLNIFGTKVKVQQMQAESGAAGAVHGSLNAGALTTTYTASQGLLLMVPNMYKIAGELLPGVFHVSARTLASHTLSIFGDHSDVMACRQTGFAMLAETNPQEIMDLSPVAHLAAIKSRVPFLNFFDGFRTSHEIQKIAVWENDDLADMVDYDAVDAFRARALNPEHPQMRGSHENGDVFFQNREASNPYYEAVPGIVEEYMAKINEKLGTDYGLFSYYGAPDADRVIVAMGSICDVAEEVIDYLNANGSKVGLIKVRLYRPWRADKMLSLIPDTCKKIAVLDRTKEPGALGEPLFMDVVASLREAGRCDIQVVGGRYGLSSKDTPPASIFAVYKELEKDEPKARFTVGIVDDVTYLSLEEEEVPDTAPEGTVSCMFWGLGGDGTVGANTNSIKIIGDNTDKYVQAYFQYDSKKTGGVTISHLRFGDSPIKSPYYINKANFVACHNPSYIAKGFKMAQKLKKGGVFLVNSQWSFEELEAVMDADTKRYIHDNEIRLVMINAIDLAEKIGMGRRTNTVLQSAFFSLASIIPQEEALKHMKDAATASYSSKGQEIVDMNHKAIDLGATAYEFVEIPASWANAECDRETKKLKGREKTVKMVKNILFPVGNMDGDSLPVSAFVDHADGTFELGASAYEKRGVSVTCPEWDKDTCIQCNQCAYVCPHAVIRPFALNDEEAANAPAALKLTDLKVPKDKYKFSISLSPLDCMGCAVCVKTCPVNALEMKSLESQREQNEVWSYLMDNVTPKKELQSAMNVKGSQFMVPYLEFSGSCAGCAETSYARLITQLYGDRMIISNATGCSSIWGGPAATSPYTVNCEGKGPAWVNSLFEDNAEHGLGIAMAVKKRREDLSALICKLSEADSATDTVKAAAKAWLETSGDGEKSKESSAKLTQALEADITSDASCEACVLGREILKNSDLLVKKSIWILGGDGWAYDIGFGGLDHVLASGEDVNVFVFDTQVYSNTGGQASKASNIGQVAQFAAAGKEIKSKPLAEMAMTYGYVYVAQVAMGANQAQTLRAIREAEAYKGPSLIIAYAPCEMHSIRGGMTNSQLEMKKAVEAGYWNLFRFNPEAEEQFVLDSKEPTGNYRDFLMNEARYSRLTLEFPERAEVLFEKSEENAKARYQHLLKLKAFYGKEE